MARKARYNRTDIIVMCVAAALLVAMLVLAVNSLSGPTGAAVAPMKIGVPMPPLKTRAAPSVSSINLNSTDTSKNDTNQNLTLYITVSGDAGKNITNITTWYRNGAARPVFYLAMETSTTNAYGGVDYAGFDNNVSSVYGSPYFNDTGGHNGGGAYDFPATDAALNLNLTGFTNVGSGNYTLEAWVKTINSAVGDMTIFSVNNYDPGFFVSNGNTIHYYQTGSTSGYSSTIAIADGKWHHVAFVKSGTGAGQFAFYFDGNPVGTTTHSGSIAIATALRIGWDNYPGDGFKGSIDDVAFYNESLSAAEIKAHASNRTDLVNSPALAVGDVWKACVTPNDHIQDGAQTCSNNFTVTNGVFPPVVNSINLTTNDPSKNDTNQNLTLQLSTSSPLGNNVTNITSWLRNGTSISLLNLPFDTNVTSTAAGAVHDYSPNANHCTLGNGSSSAAPLWQSAQASGGPRAGQYYFDGGDDILIPHSSSLSEGDEVGISTWVYLNGSGRNNAQISDDTQTGFWTVYSDTCCGGTGATSSWNILASDNATNKQTGANSLELRVTAGSNMRIGVGHTYSTRQDWTGYDYFAFYWYGANTKTMMDLAIQTGSDGSPYDEASDCLWVDDWSGWRLLAFPLASCGGSGNFTKVKQLYILTQNGLPSGTPSTFTWYLDRVVVAPGRFIYEKDSNGTKPYGGGIAKTMLAACTNCTSAGQDAITFSHLSRSGYGAAKISKFATSTPKPLMANFTTNVWHHVVGGTSRQGNSSVLYVDSVLQDSTPVSLITTPRIVNNSVYIGTHENTQGWLNGTLAELQLYNRSLSAHEVSLLYANRTDTLANDELVAGDVWGACVTPNDGTDGVQVCSNNVTVLAVSTVPIVNSIALTTNDPTKNDTNQNLTLQLVTSSPLGNNVTNITSWFRNGTGVMLLNLPMETNGRQTTNVTDYSGFSRNGTVYGAIFNATGGRDGRGAYTMRAGSNISFGNVLGFERTDKWSFTAWVKRSDTSGLDFFITKQYQAAPYTGWAIYGTTQKMCLQVVNTNPTNQFGVCSRDNLTGNGWHHVAVTYTGSSTSSGVSFYIDGVQSANNVTGGDTLTSSIITTAPLLIGDRANGGFGLNGNIDDVAIWNRTLSAHEIALLAADRKDILANDEAIIGDRWSACVTPNDGTQDGAQVCSNNVTVLQGTVTLSGVTAGNLTNVAATVAWATDTAANTTVQYGTTTALGNNAGADNSVTQHSVALSGLTNGTLYYYNVTSCASSSICSTSGPYNFTTMSSYYPNCPNITGYWTVSGAYSLTANATCLEVTVPSGASITFTGGYAITANVINVTSGGTMTASGRGCGASQSPNPTTGVCYNAGTAAGYGEGADNVYGAGAGHGGTGGASGEGVGGYVYDDPLKPVLAGSGGGYGGTAGGGVIRIITNTLTLNGQILADGVSTTSSVGAGSGGSIWVETNSLAGAGLFSAVGGGNNINFGAYYAGGTGAGGRVAVYYNTSTFTGMSTSTVVAGTANYPERIGESGTMIFVDVDDNEAFVKDGFEFNDSVFYAPGVFKPTAGSKFSFNTLTFLPGTSRVWINTNVSANHLDINATTINIDGTASQTAISLLVNRTDIATQGFVINVSRLDHMTSLTLTGISTLSVLERDDQFLAGFTTLSLSSYTYLKLNAPSLTMSGSQVVGGSVVDLNVSALAMASSTISAGAVMINATTITLDGASRFDESGRGCGTSQSPNPVTGVCYNAGSGPGYGEGADNVYGSGAGHGGTGGASGEGVGGYAYDDPLKPVLAGSGGGYGGTAGGGVIRIITNTLTLNGQIVSNGVSTTSSVGAGSGGSIWVETDSLTGAGLFSAVGGGNTINFGAYYAGGTGAGGRVAVYYNTSTFTGMGASTVVAGTANYPERIGESGTMIFVDVDDNEAFVKDGFEFNDSTYYAGGVFKPTAGSKFRFNKLTFLSGTSRVWINTNVSANHLDINATTINVDGAASQTAISLLVNRTDIATQGFVINVSRLDHMTSLTLTGISTLSVLERDDQFLAGFTTLSLSSYTYLKLNAPSLTMSSSQVVGGSVVDLNVSSLTLVSSNILTSAVMINATTITLDGASRFDASGRGCGASQSPNPTTGVCYNAGTAAGYGEGADNVYGGGAGHGGAGGACGEGVGGYAYDDPLKPVLAGSGGGYGGTAGGGVIRIIANALTLNGQILADGVSTTSSVGAGSGGSIWVETNSLAGAGLFSAVGGGNTINFGAYYAGGTGAGGRVAVYYNTSTFTGMSTSTVAAGTANYPERLGASGTMIFVDVDDNTAIVRQAMEFNGTAFYAPGKFKQSPTDKYSFRRLDAPSTVLRFTSTSILNATLLNLTSATGKVANGARMTLMYADTASNLGSSYTATSGTFQASVERADVARVDWLGTLASVNNLNKDLALTANNVFVNVTSSPTLNTSANVSIVTDITGAYSIMFDGNDDGVGELCVDCVNYGITNGAARFSAPHFSSYWLSSVHEFIAPIDNATNTGFVFNSSTNGTLLNGNTSDIDQTIDVVDASTGKPKLQLTGAFSRLDVNLSGLVVLVSGSKTVVITENITGVSPTHALYVPVQSNAGVYVCPNATRLNDVVSSCLGYTRWTYGEAVAGTSKQLDNLGYNVTVTIVGSNYKITGLRGTGVAEGGVTTLTMWDETESDGSPYSGFIKYAGSQVRFFANFTNVTGLPANLSNGGCKIDFAAPSYDGYDAMVYNASLKLFVSNRTFSPDGVYNWKVNCSGMSGGTAENIEAADTVTITLLVVPFTTDVPEFGTWALLLALGLVAAGIAGRRRTTRRRGHA